MEALNLDTPSSQPRRFCHIVAGVYKPVRAKHSRFVPMQDSLAIAAASEFSRYKEYLCPSVLERLSRYMQERPLSAKLLCLQQANALSRR